MWVRSAIYSLVQLRSRRFCLRISPSAIAVSPILIHEFLLLDEQH